MNFRPLSVAVLVACGGGSEAAATRREAAAEAVAGASAASSGAGGASSGPMAPAQAARAAQPSRTPQPTPEPAACVPRCGDRICGPDGACGQSCGSCRAGLRCSEGSCIAAERLRENGDTCSSDFECASAFCGLSNIGEHRCYGDQIQNDTCSDTFDCREGTCVPMTPNGTKVCSNGVPECVVVQKVSGPCTDFALAFCQSLGLDCPSRVPDFDACFVNACREIGRASDTANDCDRAFSRLQSGVSACQ